MKAIIEFDLPEEATEHLCAVKGSDAIRVLDEILNEIRNALKYDGGPFGQWTDDTGTLQKGDSATLERVREIILLERQNYGIPDF